VNARDVHVLLHNDVRVFESVVRDRAVADFPVEDVVVRLARLVGAQHRGSRLERFVRIDDDRERVVFDFDGFDSVGGGVSIGGDDRGHFLRLVHHLFGGQHHLGVGHQRRHPMQLVLRERLPGDDGEHAGHLEGARRVDLDDLRVGKWAAHDVHVEHAGQRDVVDVVALTANEARIFFSLHGMAHAANFGRGAGRASHFHVSFCSLLAAYWTALTMFT
jgi:hypothetical protein